MALAPYECQCSARAREFASFAVVLQDVQNYKAHRPSAPVDLACSDNSARLKSRPQKRAPAYE